MLLLIDSKRMVWVCREPSACGGHSRVQLGGQHVRGGVCQQGYILEVKFLVVRNVGTVWNHQLFDTVEFLRYGKSLESVS